MNEKSIVIIPTLNEAGNIKNLTEAIFSISPVDILIVDDCSEDGSFEILNKLEKDHKRFNFIVRESNHGYGKSCIDGFSYALKNGYNLILTMDADFSHPHHKINELLNVMNDVDIAICSRYTVGGKIIANWSFPRMFLSKFGNYFARFLLKIPVFDCTSGFRCYKEISLKKINYESLKSDGYALLIEILYRAIRKNLIIKEVPFVYVDRRRGKSKLSRRVIFETILYVLKSAIERFFRINL